MPKSKPLTREFDPVAAFDHLVYFSEEPVDVPAARRLFGCDAESPPPSSVVGFDFPNLPPERYVEVQAWGKKIAEIRVAGFTRACVIATMPLSVYWFGWSKRDAEPTPDELGRAMLKLAATARAVKLPRPTIGIGPPVTDWVDLRRPLTRATVGYRLAMAERAPYRTSDDVERYLAVSRTAPRSVGPLANAVARGDAAAARREARRIADIFLEAYISPIAVLRTRFLSTLLECGDAVEAAGVTEHVVARWADHRLRELWQVYSLPAAAKVFIEAIVRLAELAGEAADTEMALPRAIAGARSLLIATWNETYPAAFLAREVGLGVGRLSRLFKQHIGCSIPQFRNKLRLEKAAEMLRTTDKPITSIALECGFTNLTHFHRTFRREHGRGPREYRKQRNDS